MTGAIALLASPEILQFQSEKKMQKYIDLGGQKCRTAHPDLKNMFTCVCVLGNGRGRPQPLVHLVLLGGRPCSPVFLDVRLEPDVHAV